LDGAGYVEEPPVLEGDDLLLFDAVAFDLSYVDRNIFALSLIAGSRYADISGFGALDIGSLVGVHNDDEAQREHCLRSSWHDGEEGDAAAVRACRDFIREELDLALSTVDADGVPDPNIREDVEIYLVYQDTRAVPLSTYYFHIGRALHALQDSFTHTYRSEDLLSIVEVMNWIEMLDDSIDQERDGPAHDSDADACECDEEWIQDSREAATDATADLLEVMNADVSSAEREVSIDRLMDSWMAHVPDCTLENDYCGSPAPESFAGTPCSGCSIATKGSGGASSRWDLLLLVALGLFLVRRVS